MLLEKISCIIIDKGIFLNENKADEDLNQKSEFNNKIRLFFDGNVIPHAELAGNNLF